MLPYPYTFKGIILIVHKNEAFREFFLKQFFLLLKQTQIQFPYICEPFFIPDVNLNSPLGIFL